MTGNACDHGMPLAAAALRLRGRAGRPRKAEGAAPSRGGARLAEPLVARVPGTPVAQGVAQESLAPALLDVEGAARFLAIGEDAVRGLHAAGHLPRVRLPGPAGLGFRRLLFAVDDLRALVERSRER